MSVFRLHLLSPVRAETVDDVVSFTGRDGSGSFGILAHAFRRITALSFGMATLRLEDGRAEYLALPGGILRFATNELTIATTAFVRSPDSGEIVEALNRKIRTEEEKLHVIRHSLRQLDEEILKRLSFMGKMSLQRGVR